MFAVDMGAGWCVHASTRYWLFLASSALLQGAHGPAGAIVANVVDALEKGAPVTLFGGGVA